MGISITVAILALIVSIASYLKSYNNEKSAKILLIEQKKGELSFALVKASLLLQENKNILDKVAVIKGGNIKEAINEHAIKTGLPMFDDLLIMIETLEKEYKNMLADVIDDKVIKRPELIENTKNRILVFNQQCEKMLDNYNILITKAELS